MWLEESGHSCKHFTEGKSFLNEIQRETYDIAILDWELPDMCGDTILQTLRDTLNIDIPVVCTTVRDQEANIVEALTLGADDYMTKPIGRDELLARVDAITRRLTRSNQKQMIHEYPPYRFDVEARKLTDNGVNIPMTEKEFMLARLLFQNVGRMLSRAFVLETVWGTRGDLDTRTVDTHVSRVRRKLQLSPEKGWRLKPVYKFGYRLEKISPT